MKVLKVILTFILGAGIASLWWAYATLDLVSLAESFIIAITFVATLLLFFGSMGWMIIHWDDE